MLVKELISQNHFQHDKIDFKQGSSFFNFSLKDYNNSMCLTNSNGLFFYLESRYLTYIV